MPTTRRVQRIIQPQAVLEGAGVKLKRSFPSRAADYLDPFLLFDDFSSADPEDFRPGFPWHPHRGIETVTYLLAGGVAHRDSLGNSGSIGAGDVQWMTSGSGIMHEEMPDVRRGALLGFQLWVNLPARLKMTAPRYQDIAAAAIPEIVPADGVTLRVIAGEAAGARGPVTGIAIRPTYLDVQLAAGASYAPAIGAENTVLVYVFAGEVSFTGAAGQEEAAITAPRLVTFGAGDRLEGRASAQGARYLLIAGTPLGEPIARHGPFVMNTREEIQEALRDLHAGTFIRTRPESDPRSRRGSSAGGT